MKGIKFGVIAVLLVLQGCSTLKAPKSVPVNPEGLTEWSIEGEMTIKENRDKQKTYFEYRNIDGDYELQVRPNSPVGETLAVVKGTEGEPDSVTITSISPEGKDIARKIQSTLNAENMGYWLRGLPATANASNIEQDKNSSVTSMMDDNWEIDYDGFMEVSHYRLPEKIKMSSDDADVKIKLVRAETGYLTSPCPADYHPEDDSEASTEAPTNDVVSQLVPANGAAPIPRWINDVDFCKQLVKVHGKVPHPRVGLYGPDSVMWKVLSPTVPAAMGAGRALLLQTAHPWVTAGVDEHSIVRYDPIERARRTAIGAGGLVYGSLPQAFAAANAIHRSHNEITGEMPYHAGSFEAGSEYRANEVAAMVWVHATLWDTAVRTYEEYVGPLTPEELERFNEESKLFAMMFGIPESALPKTWVEFENYIDSMVNSPQLTVTENARVLKDDLFNGFGTGVAFIFPLWVQKVATSALLPPPVREGYDMNYGMWKKANYAWIKNSIKVLGWVSPDSVRTNPFQHEAEARLRGERVGWYSRWQIKVGLGMERFVN